MKISLAYTNTQSVLNQQWQYVHHGASQLIWQCNSQSSWTTTGGSPIRSTFIFSQKVIPNRLNMSTLNVSRPAVVCHNSACNSWRTQCVDPNATLSATLNIVNPRGPCSFLLPLRVDCDHFWQHTRHFKPPRLFIQCMQVTRCRVGQP